MNLSNEKLSEIFGKVIPGINIKFDVPTKDLLVELKEKTEGKNKCVIFKRKISFRDVFEIKMSGYSVSINVGKNMFILNYDGFGFDILKQQNYFLKFLLCYALIYGEYDRGNIEVDLYYTFHNGIMFPISLGKNKFAGAWAYENILDYRDFYKIRDYNSQHCWQNIFRGEVGRQVDFIPKLDMATYPKKTYIGTDDISKTLFHNGQQKLMLSEVNCLNKTVPGENYIVIYPGAAPCNHFPALFNLFPNFIYLLIDPVFDIKNRDPDKPEEYRGTNEIKFSERGVPIKLSEIVSKSIPEYLTKGVKDMNKFDKNVFVISDLLNEETVNKCIVPYLKTLSNSGQEFKKILISDIRGNISSKEIMKKTKYEISIIQEKIILDDHKLQKYFYDVVHPEISMFKFRPPYYYPKVGIVNLEYFVGDIYFQQYAGPTSTETRLIIYGPNAKIIKYNNQDYESNLFAFNMNFRSKIYYHEFSDINGLDYCFDCKARVEIYREYFNKFGFVGYEDFIYFFRNFVVENDTIFSSKKTRAFKLNNENMFEITSNILSPDEVIGKGIKNEEQMIKHCRDKYLKYIPKKT